MMNFYYSGGGPPKVRRGPNGDSPMAFVVGRYSLVGAHTIISACISELTAHPRTHNTRRASFFLTDNWQVAWASYGGHGEASIGRPTVGARWLDSPARYAGAFSWQQCRFHQHRSTAGDQHNSKRHGGRTGGKNSMEGRMKLKDATKLAQLVELLEPFEGGRSPPGVRAFRGVEAAIALNHLHRLRDDPLKDDALTQALERQMRSFAQKFEEDMGMLSPKNIAWALNALKGMEGYASVFEASAQRLCEIPPGSQWRMQSAALISNAFVHGSDGLGKHENGDIYVPENVVPHLSRVVQQLLLVAALDSLTERGGGGAAAACSPPASHNTTRFAAPHTLTHIDLPRELRNLSLIANAFSKLHAHDDDLFDSLLLAARRGATRYCEHGAPFYLVHSICGSCVT